MGQSVAPGFVIGVVSALSVLTAVLSLVTDRSSLPSAVYIFALESGIGDIDVHSVDVDGVENATPARYPENPTNKVNLEEDKWPRNIRSEAMSSERKHGKCRELVPWAWAIIQTTAKSDLEDTYYHVPRAAFTENRKSTPELPSSASLHIENTFDFILKKDNHPRCHPQCPVRLRLLPPEPDRVWPRNLVISECACKETACSARGRYQCGQVITPVLIVRGLPGQRPRYCLEMVPAGCRCMPVHFKPASSFEPFAIK